MEDAFEKIFRILIVACKNGEMTLTLYFITYELRNREKNYSTFYDSIKNIGKDSCQCLTNVWFIYSDLKSTDIYDKLRPLIEETDNLLISEATYKNIAGWVSSDTIEFFKRNNS